MEACVKDKIVDHLVTNALLNAPVPWDPHGWAGPMEVIYLDFSKAFDKVPHRRLLEKFKAHSIDGQVLKWIEEWLSGRTQRTV